MGAWLRPRPAREFQAMSIQAVIFDRDNTLLRFDRAAMAAIERQIAALAPQLPAGAAAAHWMEWPGPWPRTAADEPGFWRAFWRSLAERHAIPATTASALESIGGFYHTCFAAFPDARACVEELRGRGLRLAVLTNFVLPSVDRALAHAGLDPRWFDALVSSAALGAYKPDPRAYHAVLAALALAPASCLLVDDLPENVAGARDAGMRAVLLDRTGEHPHVADRITTLSELPALV